jgi:outer membrane receptor protein involved in Fe transport
MGASQRHPTPLADGIFVFSTVGSDLPGVANTGNAFASFLLGQVQTFAIDLQQTDIRERAHFQEYFIQDDWKASERLTINAGLRYTLNFPSTEVHGQTAVFNLQTLQLEYPGTEPVRPLKKDNFGPRIGAVYRLTDKTIVSSGTGRSGSRWRGSPRPSRRRISVSTGPCLSARSTTSRPHSSWRPDRPSRLSA